MSKYCWAVIQYWVDIVSLGQPKAPVGKCRWITIHGAYLYGNGKWRFRLRSSVPKHVNPTVVPQDGFLRSSYTWGKRTPMSRVLSPRLAMSEAISRVYSPICYWIPCGPSCMEPKVLVFSPRNPLWKCHAALATHSWKKKLVHNQRQPTSPPNGKQEKTQNSNLLNRRNPSTYSNGTGTFAW